MGSIMPDAYDAQIILHAKLAKTVKEGKSKAT